MGSYPEVVLFVPRDAAVVVYDEFGELRTWRTKSIGSKLVKKLFVVDRYWSPWICIAYAKMENGKLVANFLFLNYVPREVSYSEFGRMEVVIEGIDNPEDFLKHVLSKAYKTYRSSVPKTFDKFVAGLENAIKSYASMHRATIEKISTSFCVRAA